MRPIFFFQAEDGIRDTSVTGVQTCALPIYFLSLNPRRKKSCRICSRGCGSRSEERRVGKECRYGCAAYQDKNSAKGASAAKANSPDLVRMDVGLPDTAGSQGMSSLRTGDYK